jgi:bifunctional non-homologous end joining protein LigD
VRPSEKSTGVAAKEPGDSKNAPAGHIFRGTEAVWLDARGMADFDRLQSRRHDDEIKLLAFDLLADEGRDVRREPLHTR